MNKDLKNAQGIAPGTRGGGIAPAPGGRVGCDPDLRSGKGDFQ